ncbi:E3 ubiquitin-protein ligase Topors [Trichomycterus rosablanca]|uniref:E3 ubiquitin-protein ligase Topors n=1 Tax=Trichomycterus rosablanca TaxID=2290929 RepID=UPI002F35997A
MAPAKMKLRTRKKESRSSKSSQQQALRPETSPDSKCPICLDRFVNVASVERCLHRFCFRCIREWAKNKAECPLCKQPFRSIFHSVRAENDFKEFVVLESSAENATTSGSTAVTTSTPTVATPPAGQNEAENGASRTRRSAAVRARERRRARNPAPSGSSLDEVALHDLLPWLQRDRVMGVGQLRPFLLARTDHILHELVNFARSIEAMQCPPAPSYEEDSGSPSSIINISEDDDSDEPGVSEVATPDRVASAPVPTSSEISLSQSAWDDETPGPSYSTLSQLQSEAAESGASQPGGTGGAAERRERNDDDDAEECMIVGYVKPMAERTPELVQLSSDTSEEEQDKEAPATEAPKAVAKVEPSLPVQAPPAPSPKSFPSTSHTDNAERGAQKPSRHRRQGHTRGRGIRTRSRSSSDSSAPGGRPRRSDRPRARSFHREAKRRGQHSLQLVSVDRDGSSDEDLARPPEKSSSPFSPWDSPGHKRARDERERRRRTRKRERQSERSRSPRDSRRRDRALRLRTSSTSSGAESHAEKPAGKRKYKTRHLERRVRRKSGKESNGRERSPSVEIVYERPASDAHAHRWRKNRHKKKSRRRTRELNSPTIITIDSDSSNDKKHPADCQDLLTEDYLTDCKEKSADANSWRTVNHKEFSSRTTDHAERLTDLADRLVGFRDPTLGVGHTIDPVSEVGGRTTGYQHLRDQTSKTASCADNHQVSDKGRKAKDYVDPRVEGCGHTTDSLDSRVDFRDGPAAVSSSTFDHQSRKMSSGGHTTDYLGVTGLSDSLADHACVLGASGHTADSNRSGADTDDQDRDHAADLNDCTMGGGDDTRDYKERIKGVSRHAAEGVSSSSVSSDTGNEASSRTTPDFNDCAVDFQDAGESLNSLSGRSADSLNLEHFMVDIVNPKQPNRRDDPVSVTRLSDRRLLELEDSLTGEGRDQRDQSQAENEPETTSDARAGAAPSSDV